MKWFRERRRQIKFNHGFANAAKELHKRGDISDEQLAEHLEVSRNMEVMKEARGKLIADDDMLGGMFDWDWDAIKEWLIENFFTVMRVILPIILPIIINMMLV